MQWLTDVGRKRVDVCSAWGRGWVEVAQFRSECMADSPVSINTPGAPSEAPSGPSPQEQKQMEQAYAQMKRKMAMEEIGLSLIHI